MVTRICHIRRIRTNALKPTFIHQRGVVLIVALIMLAIISLLASFSIRNATSTEAVAGNVRTTQLATQAAEIALKYCAQWLDAPATRPAYFVLNTYQSPERGTYKDGSGNLSFWDGATSVASNAVTVLTAAEVPGTFKRYPECIVEPYAIVQSGAINTTTKYVITARGFGPEVAAVDATRTRPSGSEVWLQTTDD